VLYAHALPVSNDRRHRARYPTRRARATLTAAATRAAALPVAPFAPAVGSGGPFPPELLKAPRKWWPWAVALSVWPWPLPEQASWTSGILAPVGAVIRPQRPNMNKMFCERHPPCPSQAVAVWPPPRE
jgi:hypothetical protein